MCESADDLPFEAESFDCVINRNVAWTLSNPEKKFSQYQKDNDLFMRDLASLAGIREQALDRAEKAVGQSRDMLLKNQQAIYARLDAVTQRQESCDENETVEGMGLMNGDVLTISDDGVVA